MDTPTVVIAEDEFVIREGLLRVLLEPHYTVVASVDDGNSAVAAAAQHKPNIVLLDISLPGLRGFEAARRILSANTGSKVLFISNYGDPTYPGTAQELGASGYVLKSRAQSELLPAIQIALDGGFYQSVF